MAYADQFAKTRICKFYQHGLCARGNVCRFAHGNTDLKSMPDFRNTKLCKVFVQTGACPNVACPFAHAEEQLKPMPDFRSVKLCKVFQHTGACPNFATSCPFAHYYERDPMPDFRNPSLIVTERGNSRLQDASRHTQTFDPWKSGPFFAGPSQPVSMTASKANKIPKSDGMPSMLDHVKNLPEQLGQGMSGGQEVNAARWLDYSLESDANVPAGEDRDLHLPSRLGAYHSGQVLRTLPQPFLATNYEHSISIEL